MTSTSPDDTATPLPFLAGGGEMGARIRAYDWASTPLGPPETWPQSLRVTVRLMLNTQHPMFLWWGRDLIQLYNDGYRQTMGPEMHPATLGARGRESWAAIWPIIGPQVELVMAGEGSTWNVEQMVPIHRHGRVEDVWWTYSYSPIDLDDGVGGILVICTDVTEQRVHREHLLRETERFALMFEEAPGFVAVMRGPEHVFELTNASYRRLIGGRDVIGKTVREGLPDIAGQGFYELLDQVYQSGVPYIGRRIPVALRADASAQAVNSFLDFIYQPLRDASGAVTGIFVEGQDVTDHVVAEEHLKIINAELRHRVKNTLAMVSAVARQTFRASASDEAMRAFDGRLSAFAQAHETLTTGALVHGLLGDVIDNAVRPHVPQTATLLLDGPRIEVGARPAVALALAMHELATNAVKYGAFSREGGRVEVGWSIDEAAQQMRLSWRETGGPPVVRPERTGFGSRVIRSVLTADLSAQVEITYAPDGLVVEVAGPLVALSGPVDPAFES